MRKLILSAAVCFLLTCSVYASDSTAVYLGVENYGAEETNKDNLDQFRYRFEQDGKEIIYKIDSGSVDSEGKYTYPIQNILKEGYTYSLTVEDDTVVKAEELISEEMPFEPVVKGTPGEKTLTNFLKTCLEPVGTVLYIYGGGWDWQDEGSSVQTRSLGVSSDWVQFFNNQDADYTYKSKDGNEDNSDPAHSYYPYGKYNEYYYAGLDCSGYLGWALYNTFETENGKDGYVGGSTGFAKRLSEQGFGEWTQDIKDTDGALKVSVKPGDIMSINGHVWISLGTCDDGSVVIVHCTASNSRNGQPGGGVQISALGKTTDCEAYFLADQYMSRYYPAWYDRYFASLKPIGDYFTFEGENAGLFSWSDKCLEDPDGLHEMKPAEVLSFLFNS